MMDTRDLLDRQVVLCLAIEGQVQAMPMVAEMATAKEAK